MKAGFSHRRKRQTYAALLVILVCGETSALAFDSAGTATGSVTYNLPRPRSFAGDSMQGVLCGKTYPGEDSSSSCLTQYARTRGDASYLFKPFNESFGLDGLDADANPVVRGLWLCPRDAVGASPSFLEFCEPAQ